MTLEAHCKCLCEKNHGSTEGCDFFNAPYLLPDELTAVPMCRYCVEQIPRRDKALHDLVRVLRC